MKLAKRVASRHMEAIALADFEIEEPEITNLSDVHGKSKEKFSFELLVLWRNKSAENTKEVITSKYRQNKTSSIYFMLTINIFNGLFIIFVETGGDYVKKWRSESFLRSRNFSNVFRGKFLFLKIKKCTWFIGVIL